MASAPQQQSQLPIFYRNLVPLSVDVHGGHGLVQRTELGFARDTHAIPITVDEFAFAQRHYPIVFSQGEQAVPLALVGLQEGRNLFVDENGQWDRGAYIPAYIRRHPFMLARLSPDENVLSLVFDDSWGMVTEDAADKLFDGREPSGLTKNVLGFCEQFEAAIQRTSSFMAEIGKLGLLMEGQAQIQNPGMAEPATFAGFQMVSEEKLQKIRGDHARKMVGNGMMGLLYAHLFSLAIMRELYGKQFGDALPQGGDAAAGAPLVGGPPAAGELAPLAGPAEAPSDAVNGGEAEGAGNAEPAGNAEGVEDKPA